MIVVDVGCAEYFDHPNDVSIGPLIERFQPRYLYGYDPAASPARYDVGDTLVVIDNAAAWTRAGEIGYTSEDRGLVRTVGDECGPGTVRCFDLAHMIDQLPPGPVVLKLDCEGSEYTLLEHLHEQRADRRLELVLVEWHHSFIDWRERREFIRAEIACPVEEWH